ncbi:MAG: CHASE3 domain-containing protein, partial [Candidatus Angelobacter sp.]
MSYQNAAREESDREWVTHTYQVLATIDLVGSKLADAESEQRSYMLTGDPLALQSHEYKLDLLSTALKDLRELTADNPVQQSNLDTLAPLINTKLTQMHQGIELRKQKGLEPAAEAIRRGPGLGLMATIRDQLSAMRAEEQKLLLQRKVTADTASRSTKRGIIVGSLIAVAFLLASGLAVNRELRERSRAERALHISEEQFRLAVADVSTYAIITLDIQGNVASWNAGAERIKGYRAQEIIGKHFSSFYPQEDLAACKPEKELETVATVGRLEDEGWRVRKDRSRFWANTVITAMRDAQGKLIGFSKVTRDLTERKRTEENIKKLNMDLQQHVDELTAANREL